MVKPVIFGCAGTELSAEEIDFFTAAEPLGFILFSRNIETPAQTKELVASLRRLGKCEHPLILIDQEGGRVARLPSAYWRKPPPAEVFGQLYRLSKDKAIEATRLNAMLIAADLADIGITVNCAPVLDLRYPGTHSVIGDRAFGADVQTVTDLAEAYCKGLRGGGVFPIIKHIPGHGRSTMDSHIDRPTVEAPVDELMQTDFLPFKRLAAMPFAMTAHIVYSAIDPEQVASTSETVIQKYIRQEIGFSGVLVSDDVSMSALGGDIGDRADQCLNAGCDIALHCNGDMAEMTSVATRIDTVPAGTLARLSSCLPWMINGSSFDRAEVMAQLEGLIASVKP